MANHPLLAIIQNALATVSIRGAFGLARIVMLLLIARKFGPGEFGQLSLAISVIDISRVIADLGIDIVSIRRIAANSASAEKLLNNIFSLKLIFSGICFLLAPLAFFLVYGTGGVNLVFVLAFSIYTTLFINAFVSYFQANLAMAKVIGSNLTGVGIYILLTGGGIYLDLSLVAIILAVPLSELVTFMLMFRLYRKNAQPRLEFDKTIIRDILRESIYVGISGIIVVIYLRLDMLVIGWFVGDRGVGEYAMAYRLVEPFQLIFTSLATSLYASLSGAWNTVPPPQIKRTIYKVIVPTLILALTGVAGLSFFGPRFITFISEDFSASGGVILVLCWSLLFKAMNTQLTAVLNSLGKFRIMTIISTANLLSSIALSLILISRYGIWGAAITVVVVEGLNMLVQLTCVVYTVRRNFNK